MIKKIMLPLLILILTLSSCSSNATTETSPTSDNSAVGVPEVLGYNFVIFDSDGDGTKDDIAKIACLGMPGGCGSFRLEVFISGENSYRKVFDSAQYSLNQETYKRLSEKIGGELMIDTFYSVEAVDTDKDGGEELICRQYAWVECHAEHVGDVVSTIRVIDNGIQITDQRLEPQP